MPFSFFWGLTWGSTGYRGAVIVIFLFLGSWTSDIIFCLPHVPLPLPSWDFLAQTQFEKTGLFITLIMLHTIILHWFNHFGFLIPTRKHLFSAWLTLLIFLTKAPLASPSTLLLLSPGGSHRTLISPFYPRWEVELPAESPSPTKSFFISFSHLNSLS